MNALPRPRRPWDRTPAAEREYFDILGPGLVSVLPGRPPAAEGGGEWRPPTGGAWIHIGDDGRIRGFTGKVEMGQGTRTALALTAAEELRVPPARVEIVTGDTDLCPWDMGTFGSRSMPDAAPALAAAAAGAREKLIALAAERLGVAPGRLVARDGEVREEGGTRSVPFAELVHGGRHLVVVEPNGARTPPSRWERAGQPTLELLAREVVTGERKFVSDLVRPRMLHGAILWPPSYGARAAVAPAPVPPAGITLVHEGDFIGAAGPSLSEARSALRSLAVSWTTPAQPAESEIESYLRTHPGDGDHWDVEEDVEGDADAAFSAAPHTVEASYRSAYIAHVPLEPHCALAEWEGPRLTVWVGSQTPFPIRRQLARLLGVAEEGIRVIVPPTGSGFGGKHGTEIAAAAARLARASGRPVRVAFTREEEFRQAYFRPMSIVDVRAGVDSGGKLSAWSFRNVNGGGAALIPPYHVPHRKVGNVLARSPLPQGSYRALGANANNFARESAMDELAAKAGIDPLEIRLRNLNDDRLRAVLLRAASRAGWSGRSRSPGRGTGLAVGLEKGSRVATVAEVTIDAGRRVHVDRLVTAFEAGAVVNPENLRSQVEGAQVMALGGALFEAIHFDGGAVRNARLSQYRVPRFSDLPRLEVDLLDPKEIPPAGAGETPMIAVAPAVANAIFDATGVRFRSLPLVPTGRVPAERSRG